MPESLIQRSFTSGELAPALHARADLERYTSGLKSCFNFLVQRHGGVQNRPGLRFINACKTDSANVRIFPFVSETVGLSLLFEAGENYLRPYLNGARVEDPPGTPIEIVTTFNASGICNWHQSGNVVTITHRDEAPHELVITGLTVAGMVLSPIVTAPSIGPPTGAAVAAGAAGALLYAYVVTSAHPDSYEESIASGQAITACAAPTPAAPNVITWIPPAGPLVPPEYYVYCDPYGNGTFGFIGTATGVASFNDIGFVPDFTVTPPLARVLFVGAGNFPHVAGTHQQRRFFGGSTLEPETIFGSRVGFRSNFSISSPLQDDDAITFAIAGRQHNGIRHIIGLKTLLALTDAGVWTVGLPKQALTPSDIPADQELYVGSNDVAPEVVGNAIIYVQARSRTVRDARFDIDVDAFDGRDLTLFAGHLFEALTIRRLAYAQVPHSIVWAVRSDGVLLGLTYLRDQDLWGWHRHQTLGAFLDVCVVPESNDDAVYVIVARDIGGVNKKYIERFAARDFAPSAFDSAAFFVDSGLSYSGAPATTFAGLDHLNGQIVVALADGAPVVSATPLVVAAGAVTLPTAASNVHIGLPYLSEIETLDLDVAGSNVRDKLKRVGAVTVIVDRSSRNFLAGPDVNNLTPVELRPFDTAAKEFTGPWEMNISAVYDRPGRILVRQTDPLPLTILGVMPNVEVGG